MLSSANASNEGGKTVPASKILNRLTVRHFSLLRALIYIIVYRQSRPTLKPLTSATFFLYKFSTRSVYGRPPLCATNKAPVLRYRKPFVSEEDRQENRRLDTEDPEYFIFNIRHGPRMRNAKIVLPVYEIKNLKILSKLPAYILQNKINLLKSQAKLERSKLSKIPSELKRLQNSLNSCAAHIEHARQSLVVLEKERLCTLKTAQEAVKKYCTLFRNYRHLRDQANSLPAVCRKTPKKYNLSLLDKYEWMIYYLLELNDWPIPFLNPNEITNNEIRLALVTNEVLENTHTAAVEHEKALNKEYSLVELT